MELCSSQSGSDNYLRTISFYEGTGDYYSHVMRRRLIILKAASIILIIVAVFSVIIGVVYIATGALMEYHEAFIGMTMEKLSEDNPRLATLAGIFVRLAGTLFIGVGLLSIAVIYYGLRKAERWAWWATLIGMGVVSGPMVAITNPVGGFPWTLAIVLLVMFVIAVGLAAREVFKRTAEEPNTSIHYG